MINQEVVDQLSYLEKKVLLALRDLRSADPGEILARAELNQLVEVMNATSWLQAKGLVVVRERVTKRYSLKDPDDARKTLPEKAVARAILTEFDGKATMTQLKRAGTFKQSELQIALGWIRKKGWGEFSKDGGETVITLTQKGHDALEIEGEDELLMKRLAEGDLDENEVDGMAIDQLRQRKDFLSERLVTERDISLTDRGTEIAATGFDIKDEIGQLTPETISSGTWREVDIRRYDVRAFAPTIYGGRAHPITLLIEKIRNVFLTMGFTEITGDYLESAFWNMDVLFTAQDHPARELHDTFYLSDPAKSDLTGDLELVEIVKQVHENGWKTGSLGWRYDWSLEEAQKTLLRTHTTVNTIRRIAEDPEVPFKVFSIGRVFRNEAMDSTHLPEFVQIEGIICEEGANFDMLCTVLKEFYLRMGIPKIRIRPSYYPYTEPSLDVEIFFNGQWMELGGAGIFRPEVTEPLGVHEPVLAWGFGLERLAMPVWGLKDIRDIYISDIDWLKKMPQI
ncbi:MAG: phenylalanine--tRNA ligase subunit alpha [Methanobacteriota archaeon]|nr:MAG: phenylalanine--tRNA ligase subunit alpha [Euryarchaeota archaeon]